MHPRARSLRAAATAVLLATALAAGAATIRGPADVATLTAAADAVVRARVTSVTSRWAGGGPQSGLITTTVALDAGEWWKGAAAPGPVLVLVAGGAVGEWAQTVHGTPAFREGEEVVVFLRLRAPGAGGAAAVFEVERWALGKFALGAASAGGRVRAVRDRTGLTCVGCGADEQDDLPLDELRGRVLDAVRRSR